MNITSNNQLKYNPCFAQRINIGNQLGKRALALYADYAIAAKADLPAVPPSDASSYYQKALAYARQILEGKKPLNPTDLSAETGNVIKNGSEITVPSMDFAFQQQASKIDTDFETILNISGNKIGQEFRDEIERLDTRVMATDSKSPEFVKRIIETNEFLADGLKVEINTESGRLSEIANSDEATIFIANHGHPYDGCIAAAFFAELYKTYEKLGKKSDIPLPKLVAVKNYVDGLPAKLQPSFRKVEGVGINIQPYLTDVDAKTYTEAIEPLTQGVIANQNHVLIFPEGRRGAYKKDLPLQDRFQNVASLMVQKALIGKNRVKVVPLGLSYKGDVAGIHIGNPFYLTKEGNGVGLTRGNITPESEAAQNNSFYRRLSQLPDGTPMTVTHNGAPVEVTEKSDGILHRLITGILATNLDISAKLSANAI